MKSGNDSTIFSVGGGKGGVGKSIFCVALGVLLAKDGQRVVLVDLDLGAANLHTYLGVIKQTRTIADFILKKSPSLEDILIDTSRDNLRFISGSEFIPGMANPAHWMKLKIMRHIKALPADYIIIDLGAGVHFNTLDFFSLSDRGIVMTAPEPGAVMNAYSFVKGALYRRLQHVFKRHEIIGPLIETEGKKTEGERKFSLDWLTEQVKTLSPDMLPLIKEIEDAFRPALVVNRIHEGLDHVLVRNLISLCSGRLGVSLEHIGNIPDVPEVGYFLLDIPRLIDSPQGRTYMQAIKKMKSRLVPSAEKSKSSDIDVSFSDEEVERVLHFIDGLNDDVFSGTNREAWKLRMYFKPSDVIQFLTSRGLTHELF